MIEALPREVVSRTVPSDSADVLEGLVGLPVAEVPLCPGNLERDFKTTR